MNILARAASVAIVVIVVIILVHQNLVLPAQAGIQRLADQLHRQQQQRP